MRIAILGASSQIAKDFILQVGYRSDIELSLFARRAKAVTDWLADNKIECGITVNDLFAFDTRGQQYDSIINFIGSGNPVKTAMMGGSILDITYEFDSLALNYVRKFPNCRYIFLSSGAAYGGSFVEPADENTATAFPINKLLPADWYGAAKMFAECRHRVLHELAIVDIRVFNYFSRTQDISARFFITDMLRAIREKTVLRVSSDYMARDFIHPFDFASLVEAILSAPPTNTVVDCYTRGPIDKPTLLNNMQKHFGLQYELVDTGTGINSTGSKTNYYSLNKGAAGFGYKPSMTSWEGIFKEASAVLGGIEQG